MSLPIGVSASQATHLVQLFDRAAEQYRDRTALKADGGLGESCSYAQVRDMVARLGSGLSSPEFANSPYVGLLSENRPEWPMAYLAILAAGKTVVPIDSNLRSTEIAYIISDAKLALIFVSGKFEKTVGELFPSMRQFCFEADSANNWRELQKEPVTSYLAPQHDLAVLIYTSGTTGAPKVVQLTHRNLLSNLEGVEQALAFDVDDVFLSVLPLHHTFEATCGFLTPLMSGCTVVYARSLKSKEILEDLALNSVSIMCGVPLLYEKMHATINRRIQEAPLHRRLLFKTLYVFSSFGWQLGQQWGGVLFRALRVKAGLHTLRMLVSGGAPLPPMTARFFNLIGIDFLQGYGMTEASPVISCNRPNDIQFGSVGLPIGKLEVKIDQPDDSGIGEILVKGDSITPGYLHQPELTAELLEGGWLHTGDLGRFKDRHLWITGRRKNLIISAAGKNIYPEELEEKLLESAYVTEALVFGRKKDGKPGEEVRAIVYPDLDQFRAEFGSDPAKPDQHRINEVIGALIGQINLRVADYKRITGFDIRFEEFEKTSTKKIKRYVYSQPAKR